MTLEELLSLPKPVQRVIRLAKLRQHAGRGRHGNGPQDSSVPLLDCRDRPLKQTARLRPVPPDEAERTGRDAGESKVNACSVDSVSRMALISSSAASVNLPS